MTSKPPRPTGDAPERIWADPDHWMPHPPGGGGSYVQYVRADLAALRWHRIDDPDNPPPEDGSFLAYDPSIGVCLCEQYTFDGKFYSFATEIGSGACEYDADEITHWQPLPAPPEGET